MFVCIPKQAAYINRHHINIILIAAPFYSGILHGDMKGVLNIIYTFILLFSVFTGAWYLTEKFSAPEESLQTLYTENLKPCMNYWTTDPNYRDTSGMEATAMRQYDKGEYILALEALQRFEPKKEEEALYNLYIGICYLKADFGNLAIYHLEQSVDQFTNYDRLQLAKWYLALAYLKDGKEKPAVKRLEEIVDVNATQKEFAKSIIQQIEANSNPISSLMLVFSE